jgi:hypothetical protein
VFVNGRRARVGADGRFSIRASLTIGPNQIVAVAVDGSGNTSRAELPVSRDQAGGPQLPGASRLSAVTLRVVRRRLIVGFQLSDLARVRAELVARLPAAEGRPRAQFARKGRAVVRTLLPGRRGMPIVLPRRLRPGVYQVRVTAFSAGGVSAVATPFEVEDP